MKITKNKVKRELIARYGWDIRNLDVVTNKALVDSLISDTLSIVDNILKTHKGLTIKG